MTPYMYVLDNKYYQQQAIVDQNSTIKNTINFILQTTD